MKPFKPNLYLWHRVEKGEDDEFYKKFYLQAVTLCNLTNYRAASFEIDDQDLENKNTLNVKLYVKQDTGIIDGICITPVVHTLALGKLESNGGDSNISITVDTIEFSNTRSGSTGEKKGTSTVGTATSEPDDRPTGDNESTSTVETVASEPDDRPDGEIPCPFCNGTNYLS